MKQHAKSIVVKQVEHEHLPTLKNYIYGLNASIFLTLIAYVSVTHHIFSRTLLLVLLPVTALSQFAVQLVYFLHIGTEFKPRWKLAAFGVMLVVVLILVVGSLWIMTNLNYHQMDPAHLKTYLHRQDAF